MDEQVALDALSDTVALWHVRGLLGPDEVVSAACDALVAGVDSPTLRELAGASVEESLGPLVEGTFEELDLPLPVSGSRETQVAATRGMARLLANGSLSPAEFARWVHATIGHEGAPQLQPLVDLDDAYDVIDYTESKRSDLDSMVHSMAIRLLAGEPLKS